MGMRHGGEVSNIIWKGKQVTVTSQMLPSVNQLVSAYRYDYLPKPSLNYQSLIELNFSVR
mgnify:CR=1 FL=1